MKIETKFDLGEKVIIRALGIEGVVRSIIRVDRRVQTSHVVEWVASGKIESREFYECDLYKTEKNLCGSASPSEQSASEPCCSRPDQPTPDQSETSSVSSRESPEPWPAS